MNSEGATLFVPVLLIMNMTETRFFGRDDANQGFQRWGFPGSTLSMGLILVDSRIQPKRHKKNVQLLQDKSWRTTFHQIFLVVVSKIFYFSPWKLRKMFQNRLKSRQKNRILLYGKHEGRSGGFSRIANTSNEAFSLETMGKQLVESVRICWCFFCPKHGRIFCAGRKMGSGYSMLM